MPHLITILAIVYVILAVTYIAYVPNEDYTFLACVLAVLMPIVILAIGVDKLWGFCIELEHGKYLGGLDILRHAHQAVSETTLNYELHTSPSAIQILAFKCESDYTTRFLEGEFDLVSSEVVDFISTKVNPNISINKAVVELFENLSEDLNELLKNHINTPLVVTGWGLGGYLAILSTLWLHHVVDVEESNGNNKTKRPICITFGSPLIGDQALQGAISERPQWKPSFLNVVAKKDPVACYFSSRSLYKPLGISLFCTESGGHTAFEDQDSVLAVLDAMASSNDRSMEMHNYDNDLKSIRKKVLYRGVSELGEFNLNPLRAGITMQFKEVDVLGSSISSNLITEGEKKQERKIRLKRNVYEPTKKLNDSKIDLTYMEWYMKTWKFKRGYYDSYTNALGKDEITSKTAAVKHKRRLNEYWVKIVEENNLMPQKVGSKLRKRWLYGGTNYRRIVEPLDIGEYYKSGKKNYIDTKNRPEHYQLLERWSNEDKKDSNSSGAQRNKAASLTEDSCFYAHVEEAFISLRDLKKGGSSDNKANMERKLKEFEDKVMCAIKDYSLSTNVFIEGSSLLRWWSEYKVYKGSSYVSDFDEYMNNKSYKSYH